MAEASWTKKENNEVAEKSQGSRLKFIIGGIVLIAAIAFSMVIGPDASFWMAFHSGAGIGIAWVATSFGVNYLFELKSLKLWLINAGYHTVQFTLYGLIFGLM